ncbi:MAG: RNA polymerase sigma factor [Candidatus Limnocylindrales bacterium]|jgi:RNA polymerase sigma-70 factor (ECF subfamily)
MRTDVHALMTGDTKSINRAGAIEDPSRASLGGVSDAMTPDLVRRREFEAATGPLYADVVRRLVFVVRDLEDAKDIAQETYLRAFEAWDRFDGADARAWIYTIALRLALNHVRGRRRWLAVIGRHGDRSTASLDPIDLDLWLALKTLDRRTRAALMLSAVDGYTHGEIGLMFGVAEGTVSSWLSRGRAAIRAALLGD